MAYNRRRKKKKKSGSFFTISIIVCAVLTYALIVSDAGKWVGQNIIKPMFNEQEQSSDTSEHQLSLDAYSVFAMQTGAFESEENANKEAKSISSRGGAGYVLHDESYRVIAFAYTNEKDANNVKDQLKTVSDIDASIYTINIPSIEFKITSDEKNFKTINNAFNVYNDTMDELHKVVQSFDKGEIDRKETETKIKALQGNLQEAQNSLSKISTTDEKITAFIDVYKEVLNEFNSINESDDTVFSAKIKKIYVEMVCKYSNYVKSLTK